MKRHTPSHLCRAFTAIAAPLRNRGSTEYRRSGSKVRKSYSRHIFFCILRLRPYLRTEQSGSSNNG